MGEQYYVRIRGRVSGPFDDQQLVTLIGQRRLNRSHELSSDGAAWFAAGDRADLFPRRSAESPAPEKETPNDDQEVQTNTAPATQAAPARPGADAWFIAVNGQKLGPFSADKLRADVSEGILLPEVLVWTEGWPEWVSGASVPNLFPPTSTGSPVAKRPFAWSELFPLVRVFNDGGWKLPWVQCLFVAILFPLMVLEFHRGDKVELVNASAAFSLYFSLVWIAFFHWCIEPDRIGAGRMIGTWLLTATLGVLGAMLVEALAIPIFGAAIQANQEASLVTQIIGWALAVGLVEEVAKIFAILIVTANLKMKHPPRTCAFVGVVSGLAFGTIEAVFYTYVYAKSHSALEPSDNTYGVLFLMLITRWVSLPLLHATWAGIAGYFVGLANNPSPYRWRWVAAGLITVALLHGIYDVGASNQAYSFLAVITAGVSLAMFIGYLRSEERLFELVSRYEPAAKG